MIKTFLTAVFILIATQPGAAEELNFDGLPGVRPMQDLNPPAKTNDNCTSEMAERYGRNGWDLPERVYKCSEGNVSIYSTTPPGGTRHDPDPYIHGQRQLGERSYGSDY